MPGTGIDQTASGPNGYGWSSRTGDWDAACLPPSHHPPSSPLSCRPHAMATLVRDVAVSVSVCHLHTEQKLHGRRPHLAAACMPSCSPPAPLTHPLAVSCLPSQLCFLSTWAAPVLARELSLLPSQAFHGSTRLSSLPWMAKMPPCMWPRTLPEWGAAIVWAPHNICTTNWVCSAMKQQWSKLSESTPASRPCLESVVAIAMQWSAIPRVLDALGVRGIVAWC